MKSTLNKRMQGFLVAVVVALVAGATGAATASAGTTVTTDGASVSAGATTSALTAKQKKARKKALKKCRKTRNAKKRKACIKRVNKKYKRLAKANAKSKGKTRVVEVRDDYYSPSQVSLKVNDSIRWDWKYVAGSEPHNVSLFGGPAGINPYSFESDLTSNPSYKFTRKFTKPGNYEFVCSLHTLMRMNVKVNK